MRHRWLLGIGLMLLVGTLPACVSSSKSTVANREDATAEVDLANHFSTALPDNVANADQALISGEAADQMHTIAVLHEEDESFESEVAEAYDADAMPGYDASEQGMHGAWTAFADDGWLSDVAGMNLNAEETHDHVVLVDCRSAADYAAGHLPGAVHLPSSAFWSHEARDGQLAGAFLDEFGELNEARYHALLGKAGIQKHDHVCFYGAIADATLPAMVLDWLGHEHVTVLPLAVVERAYATGHDLSIEPTVLSPTDYDGQSMASQAADHEDGAATHHAHWSLDDVFHSLSAEGTLFVDIRTAEEYDGLVGANSFGGHIPTAVHLDTTELLSAAGDPIDFAAAHALVVDHGLDPEHQVVLYGRDLAHASLAYVVLRDLGYQRVAVYGPGWSEFGNREDTPIDERTLPPVDH